MLYSNWYIQKICLLVSSQRQYSGGIDVGARVVFLHHTEINGRSGPSSRAGKINIGNTKVLGNTVFIQCKD